MNFPLKRKQTFSISPEETREKIFTENPSCKRPNKMP